MIRVAIVEDNDTIREGYNILIGNMDDFTSVGAFGDFESLLQCVDELRPDVVLTDLALNGMNGTEGIRILKQKQPGVMILILTVYREQDKIFEALRAGASGYIVKNVPPHRILDHIREISLGRAMLSSHFAGRALRLFEDQDTELSTIERNILTKLSTGESVQVVAKSLGCEPDEVKQHVFTIYTSLHQLNTISL